MQSDGEGLEDEDVSDTESEDEASERSEEESENEWEEEAPVAEQLAPSDEENEFGVDEEKEKGGGAAEASEGGAEDAGAGEAGEEDDGAGLEDSGDEADEGEGEERRFKRRRTAKPTNEAIGDEGSAEEDGEADADEAIRATAIAKAARRARREKVSSYYSGASHGLPSSLVLFDLCYTLNRTENDQIWLACIGLTDFYLHEKVTS